MTATDPTRLTRPRRHTLAAVGLIFTAPLVAEFLLGNLSITLLPALIVLAPMYGGGALLIREAARRAGRGWPTMLLLGMAYALVEEAFTTQSLFNHDYLRMHLHLLDHAYIPALGISAWWTLFMFNLHTFWSVSVSIALVEAASPSAARRPWLGPIGTALVAIMFLFGVVATTHFTLSKDPFVASHTQFLTAGLLCILLIAAAFMIPAARPTSATVAPGRSSVPGPWITGGFALVLGFALLLIPPAWDWGAAGLELAIDVAFAAFVGVFSRRNGWLPVHTFSLAAGGALAYGLHAFIEMPVGGGTGLIARIGNVVFLVAAIALIAAGARRSGVARTRQALSS